MILRFQKAHHSIVQFDEVELPKFTILTGVNGSGKSHLLEAIENGSVAIADVDQPRVVRFNYETFRLDNEPAFNGHQLAAEREAAWQYYNQQVKSNAQNWRSAIGEKYEEIRGTCASDDTPLWSARDEGLKGYRTNARKWFGHKRQRGNQHAQGIYSLVKKLPFGIDEIGHDDFVTRYKPALPGFEWCFPWQGLRQDGHAWMQKSYTNPCSMWSHHGLSARWKACRPSVARASVMSWSSPFRIPNI